MLEVFEVFEVTNDLVSRIEEVLGRGLCVGRGDSSSQMCVETAVCFAMRLNSDNPPSVGGGVMSFIITLNDANWPNAFERAAGMRKLAIAQLGSDTLNQFKFAHRLREKTIRVLVPALFREVFKDNEACLEAAKVCENCADIEEGAQATSAASTTALAQLANVTGYDMSPARAANEAACATTRDFTRSLGIEGVTRASNWGVYAAARAAEVAGNKYLILSAELCFQVLDEMDSPGAVWMRENNWQ